ncbi:2-dehydropantoate 2-reductase [Floricoccus penangensis]|uniref:2-dehydropantoate 2-reductase n=1 Tax=Floricoccus penangensis TaxID=1859475 RepID=UPI00203B5003|nr:2-dehydropantoate 2-reductase [Floricoccus penangensis]URZ88051.1 2-dehydropantoate 2-reductase [Floricoccus penangensis]
MHITIAGAGAMGSRFGAMLQDAGNDVVFIDGWDKNVDTINKDGLKVTSNGKDHIFKIPAYLQEDVKSKANFKTDLIILFTKAGQLDKMLEDIKSIIVDSTKVLSLLNGIGIDDIVKKYVPLENIYLGVTTWTSDSKGPGHVQLQGDGAVALQNLGKGKEKDAESLVKTLSNAKLNASYSDNIRESVYLKATINGTLNTLCTILRVDMAGFGKTSTAGKMVDNIVNEFVEVANREGINLKAQEAIKLIKKGCDPKGDGDHYPSMYQDLIENDRKTEIDYINGVISRKGRTYKIPTPYCDFIVDLIHAEEDVLGAK